MVPNETRKIILALGASVVLALATWGGWWLYSSRPRPVTIKYPSDVKTLAVEVYRAKIDEHGDPITAQGAAITSLGGPAEIQLRPGAYLVTSKSTDDYRAINESLIVGNEGGEVIINPALTDAAAAKLLAAQKPAILAAIAARFPGSGTSYQIVSQQLYQRGIWASAILQFSGIQDYFHIILKRASTWQVATKPMIVISSPLYPEIPKDIVSTVNQEQFSGGAGERE
jgi:hypothetical protein